MDAFSFAFYQTVALEGKYVNDPADPGGETKWGVSKKAYPDLDIAALTIEQAKDIYRRDYWGALQLDLVSDVIAVEIFDTAINMGQQTSVRIVQKALNFLGEKLSEDGILGSKTVTALNKWAGRDEKALFICLNGFQFMKYVEIIKHKPGLKRFSRGWTKRIQQVPIRVALG
ncbi:MAG: hypothetical protein KAV87_09460 [Desulfobacteraceae bacterium]|nr:hypothetical protein [Desulfobacteraceae bacterium]